MKTIKAFLFAYLILTWTESVAQSPTLTEQTTNLIRTCVPGHLRLKVEGEVGGYLAKKLTGAQIKGSGEIDDATFLNNLIDKSPDNAVEIYRMYLECIQPKVAAFIESYETFGPSEVSVGEYFTAKVGSTTSFFSGEYLFTITRTRYGRDRKTIWKVLSTLTGGGRSLYTQHEVGEGASLKTKPCQVVLIGIDQNNQTFRFVLQCNN